MLQLDLKTFFFKTPFRDDLFFLPTFFFFLSFHAPSEFISLFFLRHTTRRKEGLRKVLDDKKCWGQRSRPALFFFSVQRAKTGTLSYPSTEINLPFKNKGSQTGL
jgi:hypothetical protein